jgi:hypothetical protein
MGGLAVFFQHDIHLYNDNTKSGSKAQKEVLGASNVM